MARGELLFRSEQVPEVHALGAEGRIQTDGPQSKRLRALCHRRDQPEHALVRRVLEVADARVAAGAVGQPNQEPVEVAGFEQRWERRHEDRWLDPEAMELAGEVAAHRTLAVLGPKVDRRRDDLRMDP